MADWNWDRFGDDDDEEGEDEGSGYQWQWGTKDGLIFLIDCTKPMFEKDGESCFELCIKCTKSVIQNKIISSDKDLLGVVFFGTNKSNPEEYKHVYVLHDLDQPGAERVLELEEFLQEGSDNADFRNKYGHSEDFSLSDALWTCSNMFAKSSVKLGYKRVMLFTCNDNPHKNNAQLRRQAAAKAEDLHENGINVELMHMNQAGAAFDANAFYKDILFPDEDEQVALPDSCERFEELLSRVRCKDHKKRALTRIPFSFSDDLKLSVGVYNLVRACTKPSAVKLYKKNNEEVKAKTQIMLVETLEVLNPKMDMKKSQTYGGKQISFEPEEVTEIKTFDASGLRLMGFKPRSSVKRYFHVKPAQFLYPDETNIEGSICMFTALLKKCIERDVTPICRYIPRKASVPRFVALLPQEEEVDEHNVQVTPPGFHVIFLPFADDFRNVKIEDNLPRANTDQIDKAKEIVKKLQFTFQSDSFENPSLQKHYAAVEAMALDRDEPETVTDYTLPDNTRMDKRAGTLMDEFKDLVYPEDYVPGAKKRGGGAAGGTANKKPKPEAGDLDIEAEAKAGRLNKLTVAVLKDCVKVLKIKAGGTKKADLVDSINEHFGL